MIGNPNWVLSDNFSVSGKMKTPFPAKVGENIGEWTILGFWTDVRKTLQAVKVQCSCGTINEFCNVSSLKNGISTKCYSCARQNTTMLHHTKIAHSWLISTYGQRDGEKLYSLWRRRFKISQNSTTPINKRLHRDWHDYKAFAAYIIQLDDFDMWPIYQFDRIDNELEFGYQRDNVRFVSQRTNVQNHPRVLKLIYKETEFALADFVVHITGGSSASSISGFIKSRIVEREYTVLQCLNELYLYRNSSTLWPSLAVKEFFLNWYGEQLLKQKERSRQTL